MQMAAKISGAQPGGLEKDGAPHFTNNEGIPWPDPTHSKTVGGLPLISDTFLLQKQQTFNRSKTLERKLFTSSTFFHFWVANSYLVLLKEWFTPVGLERLATSSAPKTCPISQKLGCFVSLIGALLSLRASRPSLLVESSPILGATRVDLLSNTTLRMVTTMLSG